jgi:pimeloyl-ACP methyl ester carboxylesterase
MKRGGPSNRDRPVVLVHGALRSRLGLVPTARWLERRGLHAWPFGYPTRRGNLHAHGDALARWLDGRLAGTRVPVLGFLTHSMGGLVVRAYLLRHAGEHAERHRVVMLSPPNRGAELAEKNRKNPLMRWLYGDAAEELRPGRVQRLPGVPAGTDVLVLAGARGDGRGYNRFISSGDDDGVVGVAEMGLPGVEPLVVGGLHAFLQWRPAVLEKAAAFLREEGGG